jgi:ankyrin repeat protein
MACQNNHTSTVLELCANIDPAKNNGATLLNIASENGHTNIVQVLCANGAIVDPAKNNGATPLFIANQ